MALKTTPTPKKWYTIATVGTTNQFSMLSEYGDFTSLPKLLKAWKLELKKEHNKGFHPLQWQVECYSLNEFRPEHGPHCLKLLGLPDLKPLTVKKLQERRTKIMQDRSRHVAFKALSTGVQPLEQLEASVLAKALGIEVKR